MGKGAGRRQEQNKPFVLGPLQVTLLTILFVFGSALNCFAFFLVARFKALRRRDFLLALQVMMADLLDISYMPVMIAALLMGPAVINGTIGCSTLGFVETLFDITRYGAMFVLAFDRFCTVFLPFAYPAHANLTAFVLSAALWLIGVVFSSIPAVLNCYGMGPYAGECSIYYECSNECVVVRSVYYAVITRNVFYAVIISFGVVLPTVMYSVLFYKARKMNKPITTGSIAMPPTVHTTHSHHRAILTFFILFATLCGCSLPIYVGFSLLPIKETHPTVYWGYAALSHIFLDIVVLLDPITIMRNQDVAEKIQELWNSLKRYICYLAEIIYLRLNR